MKLPKAAIVPLYMVIRTNVFIVCAGDYRSCDYLFSREYGH